MKARKDSRSQKRTRQKGSKGLLKKVGKKYTKWIRNCARKLLSEQKGKVPRNQATMYPRKEGSTQGTNRTSSTELVSNNAQKEAEVEEQVCSKNNHVLGENVWKESSKELGKKVCKKSIKEGGNQLCQKCSSQRMIYRSNVARKKARKNARKIATNQAGKYARTVQKGTKQAGTK